MPVETNARVQVLPRSRSSSVVARFSPHERETLFACFAQAILYLDNSVECGVTFDFCLGTRFDDDSDPQSLMPGGILVAVLLMTEVKFALPQVGRCGLAHDLPNSLLAGHCALASTLSQ